MDFLESRPGIRSYIGLDIERVRSDFSPVCKILEDENFSGLPEEAKPYFLDMYYAISEMYRVCRSGAKLGIVVGNGCFPSGVVESDIFLSKIAEHTGFKAKEIVVLNKRWCTRDRTKKIGITRESLLLWEKP